MSGKALVFVGPMIVTKLLPLRDSPHYMSVLTLFAVTSFVAIFTTTSILSQYLANYMTRQMINRDAVVSMQFLNSVFKGDQANKFFNEAGQGAKYTEIDEFFTHVSRLPDVFRANVFSKSGEILWSSNKSLIGKVFQDNLELEEALRGELHPERIVVNRAAKPEHIGMPENATEFIEFYIPIRSEDPNLVVGAVEVYKSPQDLLSSIHRIVRLAWLGAVLAGTVLFGALLAITLYSMRVLRHQELKLVETERLAVVGEMASAIAHGLRNPLAAIRSCAELVCESNLNDESRRTMHDIVEQVDRLEAWIKSFLIRTRGAPEGAGDTSHVDLTIQNCLKGYKSQLQRRGITVKILPGDGSPVAAARSTELEQVLNSLIANAIEAMNEGGTMRIGWRSVPGGRIAIEVVDSGPGMSEEQIKNVFIPFKSSKASGLGIGLVLSRRIAERLGGTLDLRNGAISGVKVTLTLPARA